MGSRDVQINIQQLRDFAVELAAQGDALRADREKLEGLWPTASDSNLFGDFPEAKSLGDMHRRALAGVSGIVAEINDLVKYADEIAIQLADRYADTDSEASDLYGGIASSSRGDGRR